MSLERGSTPRPDARIRVPICRVPPHHPVSRFIQAQAQQRDKRRVPGQSGFSALRPPGGKAPASIISTATDTGPLIRVAPRS